MFVLAALAGAALSASTGCTGNADTTIDITHDACAPLALVSTSPSALHTMGMADGQALWRDRGAPALGLRAGTTLEVRFEEAAGAFFGLYDDEYGVIYINTAVTDQKQLAIVIAHEVGHAFGLPHVTDHLSVMNPGNLKTPPTDYDQQSLAALWGPCQ